MQAMPQAQFSLISFQLNDKQHLLPHSAVSSLFWLIKHEKMTTLHINTLHQTLHNTLTIHSKHAKSLNSQWQLFSSIPNDSQWPSHNFPLFLNNDEIMCFAI